MLKDEEQMISLLMRFAMADMIACCDDYEEKVDVFTVVKSDDLEKGRKSRIVWDERRTNLRFHAPPKMPLGSSASLSHVDLSVQALGPDFRAVSVTGDLPDWFYRVELPNSLRKFFIFEGVSPAKLERRLKDAGYHGFEATGEYLCLKVLPMGWSWAPFIAHMLTLSLVETGLEGARSSRLVDGQPTPALTSYTPIHWSYLDDYGVMQAVNVRRDPELRSAARLQKAVRDAFVAAGVTPHKETLQVGLAPTLGVALNENAELRILDEKWRTLLSATRWAAEAPCLTPRQLSSLVGGWVWCFNIFRELLSILSSCYAFIHAGDQDQARPLWTSVRQELRALVALSPLAVCALDLPWSEQVIMVDASDTGYGVVERPAAIESIRAEAQFAERRGWVVEMDRLYTESEYLANLDPDSASARGAEPVGLHDIANFGLQMRVVLHLYSGRRRASDLQHYLETIAAERGLWVVAIPVDVQVDAVSGDLSNAETVDFWKEQIFKRRVRGLHSGDPCGTWSRARFNTRHPGPRPVRSVLRPWGIDDLTPAEKQTVDLSNCLFDTAVQLLEALAKVDGHGSREHPEDAGPTFPSTWKLPEMTSFVEGGLHHRVSFDQCEFGAASRKGTTLQGSLSLDLPGTFEGKRCSHGAGAHITLEGRDHTGRFLTSYAMEYPPGLCRALATCFVKALAADIELDEIAEGCPRQKRGHRQRVPELDAEWKDPAPWHETFRGRWKHHEHNNILEGRAALAALRHLARSRKNWGKRHLVFTDSQVILGAFGKGRSSAPSLLRLCRRWALFRLAYR